MKTCRICKKDKPEDEFYENRAKKPDGSIYVSLRTECRLCTDARTRAYHRNNRDRVIFNNCRKSDKLRGHEFDLTREIVEDLIARPCSYCGEANSELIGLDRVDNGRGHTVDNVVPCCLRCNVIRRDMPPAAWDVLAQKVREVRELGLFKDWVPHNRGTGIRKRMKANRPKPPDRRFRAIRETQDGDVMP